LYKKIKETNIEYDYIFRMRIDQYIHINLIEKIFLNLETNEYEFIWQTMDNFFIVNYKNKNLFEYLINNLGSENSFLNCNSDYNYILGPESQFNMIIKKYSELFKMNITNFSDLIALRISISLFNNNMQYLYIKKEESFGTYCNNNKITNENFKEKLTNDKNIKIIPYENNFVKNNKEIYWVYSLFDRNYI
jgi:hypothetical protein